MPEIVVLVAHPQQEHSRAQPRADACAPLSHARRSAWRGARPVRAVPRLPDRRGRRTGRCWPGAAGGLAAPDPLVRHAAADEAVAGRGASPSAGPTGPAAPRCAARTCGWWPRTGGPEDSYRPDGYNRYFFDAFLPPYEQTAALAGMRFLPPLLLHGAHRADDAELQAACAHVSAAPAQLPRLARDRRARTRARPATCRRRPAPARRTAEHGTRQPGCTRAWSTWARRCWPCRWRGCWAWARSSATWPPASPSAPGG